MITEVEANQAIQQAADAQKSWKRISLEERKQIILKFVDEVLKDTDAITKELAELIGRPLKYCAGELKGFEARARHMVAISQSSLQDLVPVPETTGFKRFIKREPLGVIFIIAAWNYPYLVMVNGIVPALLAGNCVVVKQAPQTFACADRLKSAFDQAGLPNGVFQSLRIDVAVARSVLLNPSVSYVHFTGSVRGGLEVSQTLASRFIGLGLELGGNDAAYVREDADILNAAENLIDGAMFNSGQSCCGIQRIYVHENVYHDFVKACESIANSYVLGDPFNEKTTLGPVISVSAAEAIRKCIAESVNAGALPLISESNFPAAKPGTAFVAPQILLNVTHGMKIMREECFGPVCGIMMVKSDQEAVSLINDSEFGLTASIWTCDSVSAAEIGDQLEVGTVFMNRCDYLDPSLPWIGVKNSGRGCTLSTLGFDQLTRPKGYHFKLTQ